MSGHGSSDVIRVEGPGRLAGEVSVTGAKNSSLKLMAAALLAPGRTVLYNVPRITDIAIMAEVLRRLEEAALAGCTVQVTYRKESGETGVRKLDPYGIAYRNHHWYAVAHCHQAGEVRTFRVDRMADLRETEERFVRPEHFSAAAFFRMQTDERREADGPIVRICLEGDAESLDAVCRHWHLQHMVTGRSDREVCLEMDEPTMDKYMPVYLMTFGTRLRVIRPDKLRRQIAERARRIMEFHADGPAGEPPA